MHVCACACACACLTLSPYPPLNLPCGVLLHAPATKIDLFVGAVKEGKQPSLKDAQFKKLGHVKLSDNTTSNFTSRELKSVHVDAVGQYVKLQFHVNHVNPHNIYNQVTAKAGVCGVCVCVSFSLSLSLSFSLSPLASDFNTVFDRCTQVGLVAINVLGDGAPGGVAIRPQGADVSLSRVSGTAEHACGSASSAVCKGSMAVSHSHTHSHTHTHTHTHTQYDTRHSWPKRCCPQPHQPLLPLSPNGHLWLTYSLRAESMRRCVPDSYAGIH